MRVGVTVPDQEIVVDRVHDEDVYVALRDAFDDVKRQLEESIRRVRDEASDGARLAKRLPAD